MVLTHPRMFQDSSEALEAFLQTLYLFRPGNSFSSSSSRRQLRSIEINKAVLDLVDFGFEPVLEAIGAVKNLESVVLQGLLRCYISLELNLSLIHI